MAAVSVFVDDAILGDLPPVCTKTGEPADLIVRARQPVGGMPGVFWLAVLLGPVSFIGLLLLALFWPGEQLTVRIPETEASFSRERQLERWRLATLGAGVCVPLVGVLGVGTVPGLWLAAGAGAGLLAAAAVLHVTHWRQRIEISIDATRRWVTLTNVHPNFVEAVSRRP